MNRYTFLVLSIFLFQSVKAQKIISQRSERNQLTQYERSDFEVVTSGKFTNPHDAGEVYLDMSLISPSGKKLRLPCFNIGESKWSARFLPQEAGTYQYSFILNYKGKIVSESEKDKFLVVPSARDGILHINDLWTFKFDSGKPFRGLGENIGWESRSFEDKKWTYDYLLPTLSANGANYFRTWMCVWNLPIAWRKTDHTNRYTSSSEYFHEGGIARMDDLVELSDSLGLHFMVSIDAHGALISGAEWINNIHNKNNGGPATTPKEFFTNAQSKAMYKNRLRYLVARWGYSPSIAAWEFFNEIDNATFTPTPHDSVLIAHDIITQWHDEMSTYLKSIDPYKHIVTTSISHRDIEGMNDLPNIDLNQKHIYNKTHLIVPTIYEYTARHHKPYVIGEFGYDWNWDNVKHEYGTGFDFDYKRGLWYGLFSPTPILPMTWWWEFFDERNMTPYFKSVNTINQLMLKAGNGSYRLAEVSGDNIETLAVQCGETFFIYALNNGNAISSVNIKLKGANSSAYVMRTFNPSEAIFKDLPTLKTVNGLLSIPSGGFNVHEDRIFILMPENVNVSKTGSE